MHFRILLVLGFALVVAACSAATTQEVEASGEVFPFEDIAVAGPTVVVDPSATTAVLTVTTSINAICAVAYGVGQPSGQIAADREMEPNGHDEHRVVLTDLQPNTEYSYRLQGVGEDGRLYRSQVYTFRTPEAVLPPYGPNLALAASVVDVSSEFSSSFAAALAIDGDRGTEWSSRGDGDDAYIVIDLGEPTAVARVAFVTREMSDGTAITQTFTVTVDGEETYGPFPAGSEPVEVSFVGQVLRFDVEESTGGNTGAVEIEVYGPAEG